MSDIDAAAGRALGEYLAWHAIHQRSAHGEIDPDEYWREVASGLMDGSATGWVLVPTDENRVSASLELVRWMIEDGHIEQLREQDHRLVEKLTVALLMTRNGARTGVEETDDEEKG